MQPQLKNIPQKTVIGQRIKLTLSNHHTENLWKGFIPRLPEIAGRTGTHLVSVQVYAPGQDMATFNLHTPFERWAAVEVSDSSFIPQGMEVLTIPAGWYAVFIHRGGPATAVQTFGYIHRMWLPASGWEWDQRPQFEILGEKYKNNSPHSEEEIWIPVKKKTAG